MAASSPCHNDEIARFLAIDLTAANSVTSEEPHFKRLISRLTARVRGGPEGLAHCLARERI